MQVPQHSLPVAEQTLHPPVGGVGVGSSGGVGEGSVGGGIGEGAVGVGGGVGAGPLAATQEPLFQFFPVHSQTPAGQFLPPYCEQSMGAVGADVGCGVGLGVG